MDKKGIFITGIGTDIGKTIVSAILTEAWNTDYYKPIQAGNLNHSDAMVVSKLITNSGSTIHPSLYNLTQASSPHQAAHIDNAEIRMKDISLPETTKPLLIEGAGGIMVPLNNEELILDLIIKWELPVILISKNYLGAINHTLLSIEILKQHSIKIIGIIYNGGNRPENPSFIQSYTKIPTLGIIPELEVINKETILREAAKFADINPFR